MKKKAKLIATLSSLGLALTMMVFAVYAATSVSFKVTTNVLFEATKHVQATITARDSGATNVVLTKDSTYSNLAETGANQEIGVDSNGQTTGKVENVKFKSAELTSTNKYYGYQITITNNDNENALPIAITTPEKQGQGYKITWDGNTITSIDVGETKKITCIIEITDLAGNKVTINNADLGLDINLGEEELEEDENYPEPTLDYLTFELKNNGTVEDVTDDYYRVAISEDAINGVSGVSTLSATLLEETEFDGQIVIPAYYYDEEQSSEELPVKEIYGANGYRTNLSNVTSVLLPETIEIIGEYAFLSASITEIDIPSSVKIIGNCAFEGCDLITLKIPEKVEEIGFLALRCDSLTTLIIPKSVTKMGSWVIETTWAEATIYCEVESRPNGWDSDWNECGEDSDDYFTTYWGLGIGWEYDAQGNPQPK